MSTIYTPERIAATLREIELIWAKSMLTREGVQIIRNSHNGPMRQEALVGRTKGEQEAAVAAMAANYAAGRPLYPGADQPDTLDNRATVIDDAVDSDFTY